MKKLLLSTLIIFAASNHYAQTPVWSTDVAPIIYNRCATCHHSGGIAPFALISYTDAVTNAPGIKADVQSKKMPPWPPDPSYNHLAHERVLSQTEINKIVNWVNGGTPQGNMSQAPPPPVFSNTGMLTGTADMTIRIPIFTSTAATGDVYQCFAFHNTQLADKFITAFEAIPGNPAVVHHVLVYADTTGTCWQLDSLSPGPGYVNFGGVGSNNATLLGGWVPGSMPVSFPNGFGVKLPKKADIVIQIHYPSGTSGEIDSTKIRFFLSSTAPHEVFIEPILNHSTNITPSLFIPAGQTKTFKEHEQLPSFIDLTLLGVAPHMHLIGKNIKTYGVTPAADTQQYINIPNWDFHWQGFYMLPKLLKIPGGTDLYSEAFYDNTTNNPENPSSPPLNVSAGEATTDEMMLTFFVVSIYQPGDENIVIDSMATANILPASYYRGQQLLEPYPNPASQQLIVKCYFEHAATGSIDLLDITGKVVAELVHKEAIAEGYSVRTFAVDKIPVGIYTLRLKTDEQVLTQKVIVNH